RSETYVGSSGYCCVTVWRRPSTFVTKWRVVTAIPRKISGIYNFCQNVSGCIAFSTFVSDRTSKIANFGVTEAGIRGDRRGNIVQHPFRRGIRPVLPEALRQARVDLPGRPGLAAWCKRRIKALQVTLEIGKRAIAFSIRRT